MPLGESNEASKMGADGAGIPLLCFAHLRWNFVYQRPQHLLNRAASHTEVYFFEEPLFADVSAPVYRRELQDGGVVVLTPLLPRTYDQARGIGAQRELLDAFLKESRISACIAWYYTPMALLFTEHLRPRVTVYDCMDQLSAFQGAPPELVEQEQRLFARADVVFTGGRSLYEEKRNAHRNVHLFPSSVDYGHFAAARAVQAEPQDMQAIARPRIGFFGVLDERLDRELLGAVAALEPSWQFVMVGPVVKIREEELPRAENIHYLGQKSYGALPSYLAHWDVAMLPFAQNASTRFISPTKTPEYLAAGKPVVSTPVRDVAEPYGTLGLARIAGDSTTFHAAIHASLQPQESQWLPAVDAFLRQTSWDATFRGMWEQVTRLSRRVAADDSNEEAMDV